MKYSLNITTKSDSKRTWEKPRVRALGPVAAITQTKLLGLDDFLGQEVSTVGS